MSTFSSLESSYPYTRRRAGVGAIDLAEFAGFGQMTAIKLKHCSSCNLSSVAVPSLSANCKLQWDLCDPPSDVKCRDKSDEARVFDDKETILSVV